MQAFCENLKRVRRDRGLSQMQLAQLIGVAKSTISMYEAGKREPDLRTLRALSLHLGVTMDELLELKPQPHALSPEETALIEGYRAMGQEGRNHFRKFLGLIAGSV